MTMFFCKTLIDWYQKNKRNLPWRGTKDTYKVWLSEIIMQQTRIVQGMDYYKKFIKKFPTIFDLAEASEQDILKLWQGLGYYSRARNLHCTARYIVDHYEGVFPKTYKELFLLKGVGDYTASAIGSICYNLPCAAVDGNVYRVLSRYFGIETPINLSQGVKEFKKLAQRYLYKKDSGTYNQALMEFGALHCTAQNPKCNICPLQSNCVAHKQDKVALLPVKVNKIRIKKRYFNFLVLQDKQERTFLQKRHGKGIWQGLYQFPLVETDTVVSKNAFQKYIKLPDFLEPISMDISLYNSAPWQHKLTHQHLYINFWIVKGHFQNLDVIPKKYLKTFPVPIPIEKFINIYF